MASLPARVVLSGYYGFGNVGDEAILLALASALRDQGVAEILVPAGPLTAPAGPGEPWSLPGVTPLPRYGLRAIQAALRDGAALVSGGGGLLQDATSWRPPVYYAGLCELARRAGRPYVICAQSLGPLRRPGTRWLARRALRGAAAVSLRDHRSRATLAALGVQRGDVLVTADPVFAGPPPEPARVAALRAAADGPVIGLSLRPTPHEAAVVAAVRAWWPSRPAPVVGLPCQTPDESTLGRLAAGADLTLAPTGGVGDFAARVAGVDLVIAERLHAVIFAIMAGVPCVAIDYDPKVRGVAEDFGVPVAGTDQALDPSRLRAVVDRLWAGREAESTRLAGLAAAARERVLADLRTVFGALAEASPA